MYKIVMSWYLLFLIWMLMLTVAVFAGCTTKTTVRRYDVDCSSCKVKVNFDVEDKELSQGVYK